MSKLSNTTTLALYDDSDDSICSQQNQNDHNQFENSVNDANTNNDLIGTQITQSLPLQASDAGDANSAQPSILPTLDCAASQPQTVKGNSSNVANSAQPSILSTLEGAASQPQTVKANSSNVALGDDNGGTSTLKSNEEAAVTNPSNNQTLARKVPHDDDTETTTSTHSKNKRKRKREEDEHDDTNPKKRQKTTGKSIAETGRDLLQKWKEKMEGILEEKSDDSTILKMGKMVHFASTMLDEWKHYTKTGEQTESSHRLNNKQKETMRSMCVINDGNPKLLAKDKLLLQSQMWHFDSQNKVMKCGAINTAYGNHCSLFRESIVIDGKAACLKFVACGTCDTSACLFLHPTQFGNIQEHPNFASVKEWKEWNQTLQLRQNGIAKMKRMNKRCYSKKNRNSKDL
eukprot:57229_1